MPPLLSFPFHHLPTADIDKLSRSRYLLPASPHSWWLDGGKSESFGAMQCQGSILSERSSELPGHRLP